MRRQLSLAAVLLVAAAGLVAAAERATFVLTNGERVNGVVVFHTEERTNIRADKNEFNLLLNDGNEIPIPAHQVVAIEFQGGTPRASELQALEPGKNLLVMRNGQTKKGKLVDMIGGDTVRWENEGGGREDLPITQVARVFLNAEGARSVYNYQPTSQSAASQGDTTTSPAPGTRQVVVDAKKTWTTAFAVRSGQMLQFTPSGEIHFRQNDNDVTGAAGKGEAGGRGFPLPTAPVGALIGRVGEGRPFLIGTGDKPVRMPDTGILSLGINDNALDDNSGSYTVTVKLAGR